jgi:esterase
VNDAVAVNGLGGFGFFWEQICAALPELRIRILDLPGHGDQPNAQDYRYSALVEDVAGRTNDLPSFHLIGWSVGAAVAWLFAARHPERVRKLVLLDPAAPHQSPFRDGPSPAPVHSFTFASPEKALQAIRGVDSSATEADILRSYRKNAASRWEPRYDPAILPALVDDARNEGEAMYFELESIVAPTLILRGERSFLRQDQVDEIAAILPNALVETIAGAGHFLIKERPQEVAQRISDFLLAP